MPDINLPRRKSVRCIFTRLQGLGLEGNVEYCELPQYLTCSFVRWRDPCPLR